MDIRKAHWTTDGDSYQMQMELTKVDKENRLVSGWASLDNPDLQGDIVLAEASQKAFSKFRGNIREMHQPVAVGRMISYKPESFYDGITKTFYNGIFVTVYVSKGAQSTWEKVLDGTLQAFSIKGPIVDSEMQFSKDSNTSLRIIKDYELEELSLVDSGGNQLANVMSFQKSVDGEVTVTGMIAETTLNNVFWCPEDQVAKTSTEETSNCINCNREMTNIGWVESGNEQTDTVAGVVEKYLNQQTESVTNEGGANVADVKEKDVVPAGSPVGEVESGEQGKTQNEIDSSVEEVAARENEDAEVKKAEDVSEVEVNEPDLEKILADIKSAITKGLESNQDAAKTALSEIDSRVSEVTKALDEKVSQLATALTELAEKFNGVKSELDGVEKRVGSVEDNTAVRKSGDLGGSKESESVQKSGAGIWSGNFLPN